jgi:sn-glycerol 3-phosphate transport system permease protein
VTLLLAQAAPAADGAALVLHTSMLPLFAVTTAVGALVCARAWRRLTYPSTPGAVVGGLAGASGPLLTMVPLRSCTFEAGRSGVDVALGTVAFAAGAAVAIGAAAWLARTVAAETGRVKPVGEVGQGHFRSGAWVPLAFLAPTLLVLLLFLYWPMLETLRLSTRVVRLGAPRQPFVCLDNFTRLLDPTLDTTAVLLTALWAVLALAVVLARRADVDAYLLERLRSGALIAAVVAWGTSVFSAAYRGVFLTTVILSTGTVVIGLVLGLSIAALAFAPVRGRSVYRTLLVWPYAISPPIAGILFFVMFDPLAGIAGHLVGVLTPWELPSYRADATLARGVVILASVWKTLGFNILFYLAGLQNVPTDVVEAAQIDGASRWQQYRHVILPSLAPITFFLIVTNVTYAFFEIFGTISYLTAGGPAGATVDAMFALIRAGRVQGSFGDGAAQSLLLFAMVLAVTFWQFRATGRRVEYGS